MEFKYDKIKLFNLNSELFKLLISFLLLGFQTIYRINNEKDDDVWILSNIILEELGDRGCVIR